MDDDNDQSRLWGKERELKPSDFPPLSKAELLDALKNPGKGLKGPKMQGPASTKNKFLIFVVFSFLALGVAGTTGLYFHLSEKLLQEPINAWAEDHTADCAVVLTGGRGRVSEGFDLLARRQIKKLIISGVYPKAEMREIFPNWNFYGKLSEFDVILEKRSRTTYGNAQQSLPLVEALQCRGIILITSNLHMYRARRIFQSVFPKDYPITTRAVVAGSLPPGTLDLVVETIKLIFYSIW